MMTAKQFAELLPEIFSAEQVRWIKRQTPNGPSALQVVQRAVGAAKKRDQNRAIHRRLDELGVPPLDVGSIIWNGPRSDQAEPPR